MKPIDLLLVRKDHFAPTVCAPKNLLGEARRQEGLSPAPLAPICVLDPNGEVRRMLLHDGRARCSADWACHHTDLLVFGMRLAQPEPTSPLSP